MPSIEITVSPAGESRVQTLGFSGSACRVASQFVVVALGQVAGEQLTSEFHELEVSLSLQTSEPQTVL